MQREPRKLNQVELGLRTSGQIGNQAGLNNNNCATSFLHNVKRRFDWFESFQRRLNLRWRLDPNHRNALFRQLVDVIRQAFPHLRF